SGIKLLQLDHGEIEPHIRRFASDIIAPLLVGELVDIGIALRARGGTGSTIWQRVLNRATLLFKPYVDAPRLPYICGRKEHLNTVPPQAIPAASTMVETNHHEWLLVARLQEGGGRTPWGEALQASGGAAALSPGRLDWEV